MVGASPSFRSQCICSHCPFFFFLIFLTRTQEASVITGPVVGKASSRIGSVLLVLWGNCATSRKVAGSIHDEVIGPFNLPNPSSTTIALESTQTLTEMSTRNLPGGKWWPALNADKLTAICDPIG
jgi:hypothetical protein